MDKEIKDLKVWDSEHVDEENFDNCLDKFKEYFGKERNDEQLAALL